MTFGRIGAGESRGGSCEPSPLMASSDPRDLTSRATERLRREIELTSYHRGPRLASSLRKLWVRLRNPRARIEFGPGTHVGPGFSIYAPFGGTFVTGPRAEFRRNF